MATAATLAVAGLGGWLLLRQPDARPASATYYASATYASAAHPQLVRLPDGSRVWLHAHSRLRYQGPASAATPGPRTAQLTGAGYFAINSRPRQAFVVRTTGARVRGAAGGPATFNVRAYAAEDSVAVSVTQGTVWLLRAAPLDSLLLASGQRAAVRTAGVPGRVVASRCLMTLSRSKPGAWPADTLRFQDAPVTEVVRALRVTYGTRVDLGSAALGNCRFTGTFAHPRPAQVLAVVAAATASRLLPSDHGGYLLAGPGCPAPASTSFSADSAWRP